MEECDFLCLTVRLIDLELCQIANFMGKMMGYLIGQKKLFHHSFQNSCSLL